MTRAIDRTFGHDLGLHIDILCFSIRYLDSEWRDFTTKFYSVNMNLTIT